MRKGKVLICGYMGSGKTTLGRRLAEKFGLEWLDLDEVIAEGEGKPVAEIIREHGEMHFRKIEKQHLDRLMALESDFVLSLGGGTPAYAGNHRWLGDDAVHSVYLRAQIPTLVERLKPETSGRPLLDRLQDGEWEEYIGKHLFERQPYYHKAKHIVPVDGKTSEEIVSEIIRLLA